jgi:Glyoxalase-like domain
VSTAAPATTRIDHLVVVAHTLAQGAAWCEATLGVVPGPGGRHALMGTHNRLLRIDSPAFPQAYLEILAVDSQAPPPGRARWFGLDDPALQAAVRQAPRLWHAVLRSTDLDGQFADLLALGHEPGVALAAERDTPEGRLRWRILVRDDGAVAAQGRLPTLIQWTGPHPTAAMPASPVALQSVALGGLPAGLRPVLGLQVATLSDTGPALRITLQTPRGALTLQTPD